MATPVRERAAAALLALLAPLLFWGCLEVGARVAGVKPLADDERYAAYTAQRHCQFGWRAAETACAARHFEHGAKQLLVTLGGSSVFGYPAGNPSFAPKLERMLKRAAPGRWRVVNRGFACKDSHFVRNCGLRALEAGADVLVIYAGHNDFANYGVWNPSRALWLERNAWIYDLEVKLAHSRAFSALIGLLRRGEAAPQWFPPQPDGEQIARAQEIVRQAYVEHVEALLQAAAERGTRVILSTVVSNLYEYPVKRADWDSSPLFDANERPDLVPWAEHYRAGIALHRAGKFEAALERFADARDFFMRGRAPRLLNAQVRALAAAHPHVELVDFEKQLHAKAAEGIGCNFFGAETWCDQFHPNARTHQLIARAVLAKLREMDLVPPDRPAR